MSSPFNVTNPLSEDHDEERDSELALLDNMIRDMGSGSSLNVTVRQPISGLGYGRGYLVAIASLTTV